MSRKSFKVITPLDKQLLTLLFIKGHSMMRLCTYPQLDVIEDKGELFYKYPSLGLKVKGSLALSIKARNITYSDNVTVAEKAHQLLEIIEELKKQYA